MLGGVSTSAGAPIVSGRFRLQSGAPPGTDRCSATRPLCSQRQSTFGCSALRLGSSCWRCQLPLAEAHAPQAKGVHERYRHGEAPTVADAVIETKKGNTRCSLDLHMRSCHSSSSIGPLERRRQRRQYRAVGLTTVDPMCCQPSRICVREGLSARCRCIEFLYTDRWSCCTDDLLHRKRADTPLKISH